MSSDGFKLNKEQIKDFLIDNKDMPSQTMSEKLISMMKNDYVQDDITLFIIKVI